MLSTTTNLGATDLQGMIGKLKQLPPETQPGTAWAYGASVNVQGYVVEKLSGQSLHAPPTTPASTFP